MAPAALQEGPATAQEARTPTSAPMPGWPGEVAGVLSSLLLCVVCLGAAVQTFQINRGAAAGFLLQALVSAVEAGPLLAALLGLGVGSAASPAPDVAWVSTVAGLPLLVFGFHWLHGDRATANALLGGVLLLTGGWDYLTEEAKAMVAHSVNAVASVTILVASVFTGNPWGMAGSLLLGFSGFLSGRKSPWPLLLAPRKREVLRGLMAAANFTLQRALQRQQRELDQGGGEPFAGVSD
ncbi:transmembrane protein 276 isoform X1 [Pogona vitticeps]